MISIFSSLSATFAFLMASRLLVIVSFLIISFNGVVADNITQPISVFKSRPDLYPPILTLEIDDQPRLSPGHIFISPYEAENPGPYIYDNEGNLVWSGWGQSGPGNAHAPHVCEYDGKPHLCFFQGNQQKGYCRGHGVIMDNQYRIVRSVQAGGGMSSSDMHEFKPINGGKTALMTVYQQRQYDMSRWNIRTGMAWIMESVFQEVDVETSEVLFEWRSLDHVDPTVSYTLPASTETSGDGLNSHTPWDYFHINSIDKNDDGDYLISSRHTCAIYKISGKDGSVIWRLHGANPTFRNINFSFSQQHDARWLSENRTHTVLSLYNNGYDGFNKTHDFSSGMIILIDHVERTAMMIREYISPGASILSSSQGNLQVLPNKNVFAGWGNNPFVSEHDEDGNLLLWGYLATQTTMSYRAQKFEWDGDPSDSPALWAFSQANAEDSITALYVSWNGATRVKWWRFYGSAQQDGPFDLLALTSKRGFETEYTHSRFYAWVYTEALDGDGAVLGRSTTRMTFVPSPELSSYCSDSLCENAPAYGYPDEDNPAPPIPPSISYPPEDHPPPVAPYPEAIEDPDAPSTPLFPEPPQGTEEDSEDHEDDHDESDSDDDHRLAGLVPNQSWIVPTAAVVGAEVIVFLFLRCCRGRPGRRVMPDPMVKHRDSNHDEAERERFLDKHEAYAKDAMSWWHWRRWSGQQLPKCYALDSIEG